MNKILLLTLIAMSISVAVNGDSPASAEPADSVATDEASAESDIWEDEFDILSHLENNNDDDDDDETNNNNNEEDGGDGREVRRGRGRGGHHRSHQGGGHRDHQPGNRRGHQRGHAGAHPHGGRHRAGQRRRRGAKAVCPLTTGLDAVPDVNAFAQGCFEEWQEVKRVVKAARRQARRGRGRNAQEEPCTHPCCSMEEGKKCCPSVGDENKCQFVLKEGLPIPPGRGRGRGGRRHGRRRGGRGRNQGRQNGQQNEGEEEEEETCSNPQMKRKQLLDCSVVAQGSARKHTFLFWMKGLPTAVNSTLTCRFDADCDGDLRCCSEADVCVRNCA